MKKLKVLSSSEKYYSLLICMQFAVLRLSEAGPLTHQPPELDIGNNSLSSLPVHSGCRYQGSFYSAGEEVPTNEPCLLCECKAAVVCKLRICQEIPVPPPPGCIVVHKARKCCARLVCNNHVHETNRKLSREQKLPAANTTLATPPTDGAGYCVLDGTVYAEGSAMRSSSLCQYCFCIRGQMKCSSPQCVIPMNGCKPKFRSYACCPTNYDCQESNSSAITQTAPSSTPLPTFLKGCMLKGKRIEEGEPVLPLQLENQTNPCQTCFCMGGVVRCRPLECDRPLEGCRPITEPGHCCPDRYDCSGPAPQRNSTQASTTMPTVTMTTANLRQNLTSTSSTIPGTPSTDLPQASVTETTPGVTTTTSTTKETTVPAESIEKLPTPARHKMITSTASSLSRTETSSSEEGYNIQLNNKSDGGSREERRNKDRHDFTPRNSFEDDEKEDSVSLSFEHQELDPDFGSSLSYEDTTDQSSSNSEMELDTEISGATEENDVESGTVLSQYDSESVSSSSTTIEPDESSEVPNSTLFPATEQNKESPVGPQEMDESTGDITTTVADTISSSPSSSSSSAEATSAFATEKEQGEKEGVTSSGVTLVGESGTTTTTLVPVEAVNFSSGAISELSEDSGLDAEPAATTVINQDVQSTEVSPAMSPTSTPSTTLTQSIPQVAGEETTVKNVQFIPFGVEDAVMPLLNESTVYDQLPPLQLAYDNHALKISLIPPTLPEGYVKAAAASSTAEEKKGISSPTQQQTNNATRDDLRNAIMDVPVSTSLYSHGYYRNGIITDNGPKESLELEMSSRRPFPGQVFDDDDHSFKRGPPVPNKRIGGVPPAQSIISAPPLPTLSTALPPVKPTLAESNPARTYSRFGIQDSAFYRYGMGNGNTQHTAPSSVLLSPGPNHQEIYHQQPQNNHHRYYNAPEQYPTDYDHMPVNEDDMVYEEDDEAGEISYDEQSAEHLTDANKQYPLSSSSTTTTTQAPPRTMPPAGTFNRAPPSKVPLPITTIITPNPPTTSATPNAIGNEVKKIGGFSSNSSSNFKPAVAYPFAIAKRPAGLEFNLGLKLSGCNIYGKMYSVGDIIRELSSACIRCLCTEVGVQCTALPC